MCCRSLVYLCVSSTLILVSSARALVTITDLPDEWGYDYCDYTFTGSFEITATAYSPWDGPGGGGFDPEHEYVSFSYDLPPGPGLWYDRIINAGIQEVTYEIQDLACLADPNFFDPSALYVDVGGFSFDFDSSNPSAGSVLQFTVSYGGQTSSATGPLSPTGGFPTVDVVGDLNLTEFFFAGLLTGQPVSVTITPDPVYTPYSIENPYWYDFTGLVVDAGIMVSADGGLSGVPEPRAFPLFLGLGTAVALFLRRRRI